MTAGYHSLVLRSVNNGGNGTFNLVYGGPDTAASGLALQTIPASNLYYPSNPSAGLTLSNSQNAAMVTNTVAVAPGALATIDNQGTELNSMIGGLTDQSQFRADHQQRNEHRHLGHRGPVDRQFGRRQQSRC